MKRIILASQSPRRTELLTMVGIKHIVIPSDYVEDISLNLKPIQLAKHLSIEKAKSVARNQPNSIVISADTIVTLDNKIYGKPKTAEEAYQILIQLSNRKHIVITAFTIIDTQTKKHITKTVQTHVYFKKLSEIELHEYLKTEEYKDAAGGYKMQGRASLFISKIKGDYFNIIGLPLFKVVETLQDFKI